MSTSKAAPSDRKCEKFGPSPSYDKINNCKVGLIFVCEKNWVACTEMVR